MSWLFCPLSVFPELFITWLMYDIYLFYVIQVGLGQLHFQGGRGVTLDINKALHYFQQAAKTGNAVANAFLGKVCIWNIVDVTQKNTNRNQNKTG